MYILTTMSTTGYIMKTVCMSLQEVANLVNTCPQWAGATVQKRG